MKRLAGQMLKTLFISYVITFLMLLILAFLLYQFEIGMNIVNGGIIFSYIFSCLIAGILFARNQNRRKYLYGAGMGLLYFLIVLGVSLMLNRELFLKPSNVTSVFFMCTLGGMLGGMVCSSKNAGQKP